MCSEPTLIVSQSSLVHSSELVHIVFNGDLSDCPTLSNFFATSEDHKYLMSGYRGFPPECVADIVANSYFIYRGVKHPLYCLLPCGKCKYCKFDYREEIRSRAMIHAANSGTVIFYTLTYSDQHLPTDGLHKEHVSQAFKRLRTYIHRYISSDITFTNLYIGEYGTDARYSLRPHYHGILFFERVLERSELDAIRDLFEPTADQINEALLNASNPVGLYHKIKKSDIHPSNLYSEHSKLLGFWPYGVLFDFQISKKPLGLATYVTKYITKNIICDDNEEFIINKERNNGHYNPFFIQMPKRIGLAVPFIDKYKDYILNSSESTIQVKFTNLDNSVGIQRVRIPRIYLQKLLPTVGRLCPTLVFNANVVYRLLNECVCDIKLNIEKSDLELFRARFEPYIYLTRISLKRKEKLKLDTVIGCITGIYHNSDYQTNLFSRNIFDEFEFDILKIISAYLDKLSPFCTFEHYESLTFSKFNYYSQLKIPPYDGYKIRRLKDIKIRSDLYYTDFHMVHSEHNSFC